MAVWAARARRALRKPPRVVARRLLDEARTELERVRAPRRARALDEAALLRKTGARSIERLWQELRERPYATPPADAELLEAACPGERARVLAAAEPALARRVDLLGSGPVELGRPVRWDVDVKTSSSWPVGYGPRLDYAELDRPSDVKVPWELSRLQWLLPAGQAYELTRDERYARCARDLLDEWIAANPYAETINWAIAMEAALRILSWTYLFHACAGSEAWADGAFRARFLAALYLHGDFVDRNLERSEVNGNHLTANATGLVFAGLFLGVERWSELGWSLLLDELPRQVFADGVDFEASTAYHRLVAELFLLPAHYRERLGLDVPGAYRERLRGMARFALAYTRGDGTSPLWGDADDARALPLGGQPLGDHRYLAGLAGLPFPGPAGEVAWVLGPARASELAAADAEEGPSAFPEGGVYVLRAGADHVFVDCGPVGLAGRGGHGHNDCLSFEGALDGVVLVTDCGAYVYTASPAWRNRFRATAAHNTPRVDGEEQNRIPESLWSLRDDARPDPREWTGTRFRGAHSGYRRLRMPVTPVRELELDPVAHRLRVRDEFEGDGEHELSIPLHLAPGVAAEPGGEGLVALTAGGRRFRLGWGAAGDWRLGRRGGWVSPSYGVRVESTVLEWTRRGPLRPLEVTIEPAP